MNPTVAASPAQELAKARRMLDAARVLVDAGHHDSAVSRAYYAAFHAACALLASVGRMTRSHDGVRALVGEHFIRPGTLDTRYARLLSRMGADRDDADYDAITGFTEATAREDIQLAQEFISEVERVLRA